MDFSFQEFFWQANVQLQACSEFTDEETALLIFAPEGRDEASLNAEEIALAEWVPENQMIQKTILLDTVLRAYPEIRKQFFDDFSLEESEDDLPNVSCIDDLTKVLTLEAIYVHQVSRDGAPYVGYQFSCAWDDENGLGVLMHKNRIIEIGGADTSFMLWIAKRDLKDGL